MPSPTCTWVTQTVHTPLWMSFITLLPIFKEFLYRVFLLDVFPLWTLHSLVPFNMTPMASRSLTFAQHRCNTGSVVGIPQEKYPNYLLFLKSNLKTCFFLFWCIFTRQSRLLHGYIIISTSNVFLSFWLFVLFQLKILWKSNRIVI